MPRPSPLPTDVVTWAQAQAATLPHLPAPRPTSPAELRMDPTPTQLQSCRAIVAAMALGRDSNGSPVLATGGGVGNFDVDLIDPLGDRVLDTVSVDEVVFGLAFRPPSDTAPSLFGLGLAHVWEWDLRAPTERRLPGLQGGLSLLSASTPEGPVLVVDRVFGDSIAYWIDRHGVMDTDVTYGNHQPSWTDASRHGVIAHGGVVYLATAGDGKIGIWRLGQRRASVEVPAAVDTDTDVVLFVEDGEPRLAAPCVDSMVRIWRVDGTLVDELPRPHGPARAAVASTDDGQTFLALGTGTDVTIWDVGARQLVASSALPSECVEIAAVATRNAVTFAFRRNDQLFIWHGQLVGRETAAAPRAGSVDWSGVRLSEEPPLELRGHTEIPWSVAWRPGSARPGPVLATGSWDLISATGRVRLWDITTGEAVDLPGGRSAGVHNVRWAPDGALIACAHESGARIFAVDGDDVSLDAELSDAGGVTAVAWSPDGEMLATGGDDALALWSRRGWREIERAPSSPGGQIWTLDWSSSEDRILSITPHTSEISVRTPGRLRGSEVLDLVTQGAVGQWSPDGSALVTRGDDNDVVVSDVAGDRELLRLRGHTGPVWFASWSPEGGCIVTASTDLTARVWDARTGQRLVTVAHPTIVTAAAIRVVAPNRAELATTCADKVVRAYTLEGIRAAGVEAEAVARSPVRDVVVRGMGYLAAAGLEAPLGLLLPLVDLLDTRANAPTPLGPLVGWPGVRRLRGLAWPTAARVGLAALLLAELPPTDRLRAPVASPAVLRAALEQALDAPPAAGARPAAVPPLDALRGADARCGEALVGLLAAIGWEAVADDPSVPLRLRDQVHELPVLTDRQRAALLVPARPRRDDGGVPDLATAAGPDSAGTARSGRLTNLLGSQLALPDAIFAARLTTADLLYRQHLHPVRPAAEPVALVLDTGPTTYGPVEALLRLAAHRLAELLCALGGDLAVVTSDCPSLARLIEDRAGLATVWQGRTLAVAQLAPAVATAQRTRRRVVVATHHRVAADHQLVAGPDLRLLTTHTPVEPDPPRPASPFHLHLAPTATDLDRHLEHLVHT